MLFTRRYGGLLAVCFAIVSVLSTSSYAKFIPRVESAIDGKSAFVLVNGRKCIELKKANGNLTPKARADVIAQKLLVALGAGASGEDLSTMPSGDNTRVMIGENILAIATVGEAKARGMSTADLADMWVANLRKLMALPPLSVSSNSVTVPLGEPRSVSVQCLLPGDISAEITDGNIVSVDGKSKPGTLVITGLALGRTNVTLVCGEYSTTIDVVVRKYAAYAPSEPLKAVVTGRETPAEIVKAAALEAARAGVRLEPDARLQTAEPAASVRAIGQGRTATISVKVEASGLDYIPAKLTIPVQVENRRMPDIQTSWIMYSNSPERFTKYQTLFCGRMSETNEAVRLLYHHQNAMGKRVGFVIDVVNPSDAPVSMHVVEGISYPMVDTVLVGYRAGRDFMSNQRACVGRVIELAPHTRRVLVTQGLDHDKTASGIMELRQLSGTPALMRVAVKPESMRGEEDPEGIDVPLIASEWMVISTSEHIYPKPEVKLEAKYTTGKPWVFLRLGKNALKHETRDLKLYGNYGVTYNIDATMENPSTSPQRVEVVFEATAGPASGVFYIDGREENVRFLTSTAEQKVYFTTLAAGESKTLKIVTMPLSGSAYPATIIIRPVGMTAGKAD